MAEAINHTFSSSNTLIEDLKKKIKTVEKELETIASTVKDLSVSFPLIGQKEKEKKQLLLQLQSMQEPQKDAAQALPMHVQIPYQPRQLFYKDLTIPLTSPFSPTSQNLQPLVMTHPSHNPFRPSGILSSIIRPAPSQPKSQVKPQNDSPFTKKDKEPVYQLLDPTVGASSRPPEMNMLTVDPDPKVDLMVSITSEDGFAMIVSYNKNYLPKT